MCDELLREVKALAEEVIEAIEAKDMEEARLKAEEIWDLVRRWERGKGDGMAKGSKTLQDW